MVENSKNRDFAAAEAVLPIGRNTTHEGIAKLQNSQGCWKETNNIEGIKKKKPKSFNIAARPAVNANDRDGESRRNLTKLPRKNLTR